MPHSHENLKRENDKRENRHRDNAGQLHTGNMASMAGGAPAIHPADLLIVDPSVQAVIDASLDSIIFISEDGIICACNIATEKLFGYTSSELLCADITRLMPEPYASRHQQFIRAYIASGKPYVIGIGREVEGLHKHGTRMPLHLSLNEFRYRGRRFFAGFLRDLREQKNAASALQQQHEQLTQRLRNRTEEMAAAYRRLQLEAGLHAHAAANTRQLLACLRQRQSRRHDEPHEEPCSAIDVINEVLHTLADMLPRQHHASVSISNPCLPRIGVPAIILRQIMLNLCMRAVFTGSNITIAVTPAIAIPPDCLDCQIAEPGDFVCISVIHSAGSNPSIPTDPLMNGHLAERGSDWPAEVPQAHILAQADHSLADTLVHEFGGHLHCAETPQRHTVTLWLPVCAETAAGNPANDVGNDQRC